MISNPVARGVPKTATATNAVTSNTITPAAANELVIVVVTASTVSGTFSSMSIADSRGDLTWTNVSNDGGGSWAALFYAFVPDTDSFTVTVTAGATSVHTAGLTVSPFGVSGAAAVVDIGYTPVTRTTVALSAGAPASTDLVMSVLVCPISTDPHFTIPSGQTALWTTDRKTGTELYDSAAYKNGSATANQVYGGTATDVLGSGIAISAATVPDAPVITFDTTTNIISWDVPDDGGSAITGYNLYAGSTAGGETDFAGLGTTTGHFIGYFLDVANSDNTYWEVTATNGIGESSKSNEIGPITPTLPDAPTLSLGDATNVLVWTVPTNMATNSPSPTGGNDYMGFFETDDSDVLAYAIFRSTSSGVTIPTFDTDTLEFNGSDFLDVVYAPQGDDGDDNGVLPLTYTDATQEPETIYYYKVAAANGVIDSTGGSTATIVVGAGSNELESVVAGVPNAPAVTTTARPAAVVLAWLAPGNNGSAIDHYNVYRGSTSGGEGSHPLMVISATNKLDAPLEVVLYNDHYPIDDSGRWAFEFEGDTTGAKGPFFYKVAAVNAVGESLSNEVGPISMLPLGMPPTRDRHLSSIFNDDGSVRSDYARDGA